MCQSKRECGRQTLTELLIRPVQRLGSVCLLLNDLLKHTRKERDHPDAGALDAALGKIKEASLEYGMQLIYSLIVKYRVCIDYEVDHDWHLSGAEQGWQQKIV